MLARHHACRQSQILQAPVGAGTDKNAVERDIRDARAGGERHVLQRAGRGLAIHRIREGVRVRHASRNVRNHAGVGAPGNLRSDPGGVKFNHRIIFCADVAGQRFPTIRRALEILAARHEGAALEISKRGLVGTDHAGARAAFDGHIADGHAAIHGERANGFAGVFDHVAVAAGNPDFPDDGQNDVLGGHARRAAALDAHQHRLRLELRKALRGEHVLDLARADAKGEGAEGSVCGGVAVAANDRLAG